MDTVQLFDLASQQARWLSVRQTAVANNIANANTPGYRSVDVQPFRQVLDNSLMMQTVTHPSHMRATGFSSAVTRIETDGSPSNTSSSTVKLENELVKSGEVAHAYELNTAIVKAFHRMVMMTVKT